MRDFGNVYDEYVHILGGDNGKKMLNSHFKLKINKQGKSNKNVNKIINQKEIESKKEEKEKDNTLIIDILGKNEKLKQKMKEKENEMVKLNQKMYQIKMDHEIALKIENEEREQKKAYSMKQKHGDEKGINFYV